MNIRNESFTEKRNHGIDFTSCLTPDTDQLLREASAGREKSMAGNTQPNESAATLEVLNNFLKTFNNLTGITGNPTADATLANNKDSGETTQNHSGEQENSDSVPPEASEQAAPEDNTHRKAKAGSKKNKKTRSSYDLKSENASPSKTTCSDNNPTGSTPDDNLYKRIQSKLWFTPMYPGDEKTVDNIRRIKKDLSALKSYDDLIRCINDFLENNHTMDSELFFILHNIYTLDNPEKYYQQFRSHAFSYDNMKAGKGEEIDMFLDSLAEKSE